MRLRDVVRPAVLLAEAGRGEIGEGCGLELDVESPLGGDMSDDKHWVAVPARRLVTDEAVGSCRSASTVAQPGSYAYHSLRLRLEVTA